MKDFRINKKEKPDYIIDFSIVGQGTEDETLEVEFADGKTFTGYEASKENLDKIEQIEEQQVTAGIGSITQFERLRKRLAIAAVTNACVLAGASVSLVDSLLTQSSANQSSNFTIALSVGIGAVSIFTIIKSAMKLNKTNAILGDLYKFSFRNDKAKDLQRIDDYPNALCGLSEQTASLIVERREEGKNPFSVIYSNDYTQSDLVTICDNMAREDSLGFTYKKQMQN